MIADVAAIAAWIVKLEDNNYHPGACEDLGDGAGLTRMGITQRWHSADVPPEFFTTMPNVQAYGVAQAFYISKYCLPLHVPVIDVQVGAPLVSFAVNATPKIAVETLQQVLDVTVDGAFGPNTLAELLSKDPAIVAKLFQAAWADFYHRDVALNPSKAKFLGTPPGPGTKGTGWLGRAGLIYPATL